jgi:hypothetical protein
MIKHIVTVVLACGLLGVSSRADQYTVRGTFAQSAVPADIAVGDTFTLTFDYNTSGADVFSSVPFAVYLNAVSNLTFSLNPASMGTYAGGTMRVVPSILLTDDFGGVDSFTMRPAAGAGSTFAAADGKEFGSLWLQLDGSAAFAHVQSTGDVLSDILPVIDLSSFNLGARLTLEFGTDRSAAVANVTSITYVDSHQVPDAGSTVGFLTISFIALLNIDRRRRDLG